MKCKITKEKMEKFFKKGLLLALAFISAALACKLIVATPLHLLVSYCDDCMKEVQMRGGDSVTGGYEILFYGAVLLVAGFCWIVADFLLFYLLLIVGGGIAVVSGIGYGVVYLLKQREAKALSASSAKQGFEEQAQKHADKGVNK